MKILVMVENDEDESKWITEPMIGNWLWLYRSWNRLQPNREG